MSNDITTWPRKEDSRGSKDAMATTDGDEGAGMDFGDYRS
jgi:hypothetical protein